ncbi:unnamed protein product [Diamesa serratosioi]
MPLQNIFGMFFPLVAAVAIGALAIGFFYRNREQDYNHDDFRSRFRPEEGYDTSPDEFTFPRRLLDDDEEEHKCRICLDIMEPAQKVRVLSCVHKFHLKCIQEWLRHDSVCPLCRKRIH